MKQMRSLLQQLRQCCALKGRKAGSSLGMVMIVGTALVIWVMAIMPLMTTTGTTAIKTQNTQVEYLTARSSIEFSKSELEKIVETQIPYTFAVIKEDNGKFSALPKKDGIMTNAAYQACVVEDALDDTKDVPEAGEAGAKVAAICAAELNPDDPTQYILTITTFKEGEKNLTYSAIYTLNGSLLIYPESYKQNQALPLSDFVLVDGKLGVNEVWDSTIESKSDTSYTETLKTWQMEPAAGYANSGEYPSVFKMTALAAESGVSVGEAIIEDPLTDQKWIMPTATTEDVRNKPSGSIWVEYARNSVRVYMMKGTTKTELDSDDVKVYFNGVEGTSLPTKTGSYTISVDYNGTGTYNETANAANVLPIQGLALDSYTVAEGTRSMDNCKITKVDYKENSNTFDVTMSWITGAQYGYTTKSDGTGVTWTSNNTIYGLSANETYYFYCYCPAGFDDNGVFYRALSGVYVGMVYPFNAVSNLEHEGQYMVVREKESYQSGGHGGSGKRTYSYYAMSGASNLGVSKLTEGTHYRGKLNKGIVATTPSNELVWTMLKKNPNRQNTDWLFTKGNYNSEGKYTAERYIRLRYDNISLSTKNEYNDFEINFYMDTAYASRNDSYLEIGENYCSTDDRWEDAAIRFIKVPVAGSSTVEAPISVADQNYTFEFAYDSTMNSSYSLIEQVYSLSNKTINPYPIYANGTALGEGDKLNAGGTYSLVGQIKTESASGYIALGTAKVTKAVLPADLIMTLAPDELDELKVKVTGTNWHTNGGVRYFGYRSVDETDFHWFTSVEDSYTFRLDYGKYVFAIAESGTKNYAPAPALQSSEYEIVALPVELTAEEAAMFIYNLDRSNLSDIKATWYELPKKENGTWKVLPSKVTMVYGTPVGESGISWSYDYSSDVRFYGINVKGSAFNSLESVLQLSQPIGVTHVNGRYSSMIKGSSLYFMGEGASINTYGNDIYVTTDTLVLKNPVTGGGRVIVNPYSTGEDDPGNTLVFFVTAMGNFEAKNFYIVPAGTDLNNVSATNAAAWKCVDDDGNGTVGTDFADKVKYYFRNKVYPEANLDIAYATKDQLKCVVSSETMGWSVDGKFKGSDDTSNASYVVCAYINEITDTVNLKANRVLIAAKAPDNTYTLNVPKNVKFTTRYLSVDADNIVQSAAGVKFELYNLAQDQNFISWISNLLGVTNYSSKTLQMDYERHTNIINSDGTMTLMKSEVCRYDDGTNLFVDCSKNQELMATYTTSEIEDLFTNGWKGTVKTINRYMALECDKPNGKMSISAISDCYLDMYANYVYFDDSIKEISFTALVDCDFRINSQESGYTEHEYLGWFRFNSAESYSGTLIYFAGNTTIKTRQYFIFWPIDTEVKVEKGFYYIPASDGGTTLLKLASEKDKYRIDESNLKNYSVYIDPATGSLSNAYVDTGIFDNSTVGLGGFSGGSMK